MPPTGPWSSSLPLTVQSASLDPPNFTFHSHVVGLERIRGRASQHAARADVEFGTVPWTGHSRPVEFTFRQWTLPTGAFGLRRAEIAGDLAQFGCFPRFEAHLAFPPSSYSLALLTPSLTDD